MKVYLFHVFIHNKCTKNIMISRNFHSLFSLMGINCLEIIRNMVPWKALIQFIIIIIIIIIYLTAIGLSPGGSSTTIGHNRQVTHITQSNNTFKQDTNRIHNNKDTLLQWIQSKYVLQKIQIQLERKKNTTPKTQLIKISSAWGRDLCVMMACVFAVTEIITDLLFQLEITAFWDVNCTGAPISSLVMWDLWWTKWRWGRFSQSTSVSPANLYSTSFSTITITCHPGLVQ
jgi:hypothetical protein